MLILLLVILPIFAQNDNKLKNKEITKTEQQWVEELSPLQYRVLRQGETEIPFKGKYVDFTEDGNYYCAGCGAYLFSSETKYNSGCGWPSFYAPADTANIVEVLDKSHGMIRTEIRCKKCGGHLGHLFNDGPKPSGMRYCVNSASLKFKIK
jgi:peptide-methionine (R)-S-oxide reductase